MKIEGLFLRLFATLSLFGLTSQFASAQLTIIHERRVVGNTLTLEISASGSLNLLAMQGSFRFDGRSLSFNKVEIAGFPTLRPDDFSLEGNSSVNMVWVDPDFTGQVLPSNELLFSLEFTILNNLNTQVVFANCPLDIEALDNNGDPVPVSGSLISNQFCTVINGTVWMDLDRNCRSSSGDRPFAGVLLEVSGPGGDRLIRTDNQGRYQVVGNPGNYFVRVVSPEAFWDPCRDTASIRVNSINNPRTFDFFMNPGIDCPTIQVRAGVAQMRPCTRETIFVHYRNAGTVLANQSDLEVRIDPRLTLVDVNLPHTIMPPGIIFIQTGDLQPGQGGIARLTVDVPCDAALEGAAMCVQVNARPGATCLAPSAGWTGANLRLRAVCMNNTTVLTATNEGNGAMGTGIPVYIFRDGDLIREEILQLTPGQSFTWEGPADGFTYTILTEQVPGFPVQGPISASVESCGSVRPESFGFVNQFPRQRSAFSDHRICVPIDQQIPSGGVAKWAHTKGYGEQADIRKDAIFEYVISAAGPGTSINQLLVIDTLDVRFDPESFRITSSSHPVNVTWVGDRILYFLLNLSAEPVSANEFTFIQYEVRLKENVSTPDLIYNMASIYRNMQSAQHTDKVRHRIVDRYGDFTTSLFEPSHKEKESVSWYLAPNPSSDFIMVKELTWMGQGGDVWYEIIDVWGRRVDAGKFTNERTPIAVSSLAPGIYRLILSSPTTSLGSKSFMKW